MCKGHHTVKFYAGAATLCSIVSTAKFIKCKHYEGNFMQISFNTVQVTAR